MLHHHPSKGWVEVGHQHYASLTLALAMLHYHSSKVRVCVKRGAEVLRRKSSEKDDSHVELLCEVGWHMSFRWCSKVLVMVHHKALPPPL